jgi:hypothetical protein
MVLSVAELTCTESNSKTAFEIFRNRIGQWCARRADGLVFGTFLERDAALHFARAECSDVSLLRLIVSGRSSPQS